MKKLRLTFVILFFLGFSSAFALDVGAPIPRPSHSMKNIDGSLVTLGDFKKEKGLLVIFSCNSCPWVKAWESRMASIGNDYSKKGVGVILINSNDARKVKQDSFEEMQKRAKEVGFEFPYVVDEGSTVARAFGATKTPEVYLFNAEGILVYQGAIDDHAQDEKRVRKPYLLNALKSLVEGKEISQTKTKAMGCTIKFSDPSS